MRGIRDCPRAVGPSGWVGYVLVGPSFAEKEA